VYNTSVGVKVVHTLFTQPKPVSPDKLLLFHNWRSIYSVEQVAYEAENGHFSFAQLSSLSSFHHFVTPTSPNPRPVEMAAARSAAPTPEPSLESIVVTLSA
jgi:hypothetical protein